jgi:predicted MFS family arabinose efflux permease
MSIRFINLLSLSVSQVFSKVADRALLVGFSWFILQTYTKSDLALFFIITLIPHFLISFFSANIINRISPLSSIRYMEFFRSMSMLALVLTLLFYKINFWPLVIFVTISNIFAAVFNPALMTVPKQLDLLTQDYQRIVGILNGCSSVARMIGPIIAVPIYQFGGLIGLTIFIFVLYILAWLVELLISASPWEVVCNTNSKQTKLEFLLHFIDQHKLIFILFFIFFCINLVVIPIQIFMPLIVNEMHDSNISSLSLLEGSLGAGLLVGAILISIFPLRAAPWKLIGLPYIMVGICYICLSSSAIPLLNAISIFLFGIFLSIGNINTLTFYQLNSDKNHTAIIMSIVNFISNASGPLAMMFAAIAISLFSFHSLLMVYSILCLLMGTSLVFIKDFRRVIN